MRQLCLFGISIHNINRIRVAMAPCCVLYKRRNTLLFIHARSRVNKLLRHYR